MGREIRADAILLASAESGGSVAEPSVDTTPPAPPEPGYTPRRLSRRPLGCLIEIAETLVLTIIIFWLIQSFVAQPYRVEQHSMETTFLEGHYVLVDKLSPHFDSYSRGDIVVFSPVQRDDCAETTPPGPDPTPYIKRVIGESGDTVKLVDGRVVVNGVTLAEPYVHDEPTESEDGDSQWTVPAGRLFVMGDNRVESSDSRSFGPVCVRDVIGRAWLRYWPLNTIGILQTPTYSGVPAASPLPTLSVP
jgi:signal peptidase I